jgi:hypothetical protein
MEALGIPELTSKQIEELCLVAEKAAREYVHSRIPSGKMDELNVSAEAEGAKPVVLKIDVEVTLSPSMQKIDAQKLVDEAVEAAFFSAEKCLKELACHSLT